MNFLRKNDIEFPTLRHLPSKHDILTIVTPNLTWLEPIETRHIELSRGINFEEIEAQKGPQTDVRKSD